MKKPPWGTVAIVGVGLIGGSVGLALRKRRLAERVVGIGRRMSSLRIAQRRGAVHQITTRLAAGVDEADLVVVCTPVDQIVEHVRQVAAACPEGALITDAGSTKQSLVAALDGRLPRSVRFVGSHPLAGSHHKGPAEARHDLFQARTVIVTPGPTTRNADAKRVARFWRALGARVVEMPAEQHDRVLAATSHAPHVMAAALAAATPAEWLPLTAGGWRDTTRIAAGDPALWSAILTDNRRAVLAALDAVRRELDGLTQALVTGDFEVLEQRLQAAQTRRELADRGERRAAATRLAPDALE